MKPLWFRFLANGLLLLGSVAVCFGVLEGFLRVERARHRSPPAVAAPQVPAIAPGPDGSMQVPADLVERATRRLSLLTLPEEWKRTPATVPGVYAAHSWHGVLFVQNEDGFRWSAPVPPKRPGTYRVMVVGDSLTYGYGLDERDTFVALLNAWLGADHLEFLNLGVPGHQSEDVLRVVRKFLPSLDPDLVLYAVCLNDFLPSGKGQYRVDAYPIPLPRALKRFVVRTTLSGPFLRDRYDAALRSLHLRYDFFDDILSDFDGYQRRFGRDVAEMNATVRQRQLPPIVSLVLDQTPKLGGRGYAIARTAERLLTDAGAVVIPTEEFYRRYDGVNMSISRWEGHPNEVANYIWATMIARELRARPDVQAASHRSDG